MESFIGYIKSPQDALLIFEACRRGVLNRVQRRLTSKERMDIRSGSVFAFDEREAGMRRWTDGRTWSPSRVLGSFLTYKELDTKRRPRRNTTNVKQVSFSYKHNGLIKQSFSICTASNQKIHLISYYSKSDIISGKLSRPSNDPMLNTIEIPKGLYPELNPLDIGGGHSASIHSILTEDSSSDLHSNCSSSSLSPTPPSLTSASPQSSEEDDYTSDLLSPLSSSTQYNTSSPPSIHSNLLPIQDIAWEKLPSSEDIRQLNALRNQVRI
jgi:hypothetical protein